MSGETFETLLAANLRDVQRLVHSRLGSIGHAEDVLQDALLRAFAHRDQLRVEAKFKTWLWSIALNEIRQHFRRDRGILSLDEFPNFDLRDTTLSPLARVGGWKGATGFVPAWRSFRTATEQHSSCGISKKRAFPMSPRRFTAPNPRQNRSLSREKRLAHIIRADVHPARPLSSRKAA